MTQEELIAMALQAGMKDSLMYEHIKADAESLAAFAKLVEEHVRKTIDAEAKAHLEELRKNFDTESAELRLHMWSQEKQA